MLRLKPFLCPIYPKINKIYKFHSKAVDLPEAALNLPYTSCAQSETVCSRPTSLPIDGVTRVVPCAQMEAVTVPPKSLPIDSVSFVSKETTSNASKSISINVLDEAKNSRGRSQGVDKKAGGTSKSRKGKRCGQAKPTEPQNPGTPGGYYIDDKCGFYDIPKTDAKKWKTISYTLLPLVLGLSAFILATKEEGPEPEYIPYSYMYIRTKRFPWRDGKTSLFHGPNNLIPEEEEKRLDQEAKERQSQDSPTVTTKYKKHADEMEEKIKKRERHAQEELERRRKCHEKEQQQ